MNFSVISKAFRAIETRLRKATLSPVAWLSQQVLAQSVMKLGSGYGGWSFFVDPSLENGEVILCGAGEDISFDLALQKQFHCQVVIVDPTPRAVKHFENVLGAYRAGGRYGINNSSSQFYDFAGVDFSKIHFVPVAVWHEQSKMKFWVPFDNSHVSHSIVNYQRTSRYIEVNTDTLNNILRKFGMPPDQVSLLKLDIEGAEYSVIDWMCRSRFLPQQVLIEFDEMNFPNIRTRQKVKSAVRQLLQAGYRLIFFDGTANCCFLKNNHSPPNTDR
jgi:FkbM family methyltransferase